MKSMKKFIAIILVIAITLSVIPIINIPVNAKDSFPMLLDTIVDEALVRSGNTNKHEVIRTYPRGVVLTAIGSAYNSSGNLWYELKGGGWIYCERVQKHIHNYPDNGVCKCGKGYHQKKRDISETYEVKKEIYTRYGATENAKFTNNLLRKGDIIKTVAEYENEAGNKWLMLTDGSFVFSGNVSLHFWHETDRNYCSQEVIVYSELTTPIFNNNRQDTVAIFYPGSHHLKKTVKDAELCVCGVVIVGINEKVTYEKHNFKKGYCSLCYALDPALKQKEQISYEQLSLVFDVCGLYFIGCDIANVELAIRNGQYGDAVLNGISVVPIVGDGVAFLLKKGGKVIGKIGKLMGNIVQSGKIINKVETIADISKSVKTASKLEDAIKITKTHDKLFGFSKGFDDFDEFKDWAGKAGDGRHWHHIVEQNQIGKSGFSSTKINNTDNIINISADVHAKISGHYKTTTFKKTQGKSVRDWLAETKTFEEQYEYGIQILKEYGVLQ